MPVIGAETKKVSELVEITSAVGTDEMLIHSDTGLKKISVENLIGTSLDFANAGSHNSIYRGKFLGTEVTEEQYTRIGNGKFKGMYVGDYWTINGVNWRIAGFDYYYNCGDTNTTKHHVVIVPDTPLYDARMNATNTTDGAYVGSEMYTTNLANAKTIVENAFPGHVLSKRLYLNNAVTNGIVSAGIWVDSTVDLMCEHMVYGSGIFSPVSNGSVTPANHRADKTQLPLFTLDPTKINIRRNWWLRDVVSASYFVYALSYGRADFFGASNSIGVRPAFAITN